MSLLYCRAKPARRYVAAKTAPVSGAPRRRDPWCGGGGRGPNPGTRRRGNSETTKTPLVPLLPLVLKNCWRNRRRAFLTIASISVSMCLLGVMIAMYHALYLSDATPEEALRR